MAINPNRPPVDTSDTFIGADDIPPTFGPFKKGEKRLANTVQQAEALKRQQQAEAAQESQPVTDRSDDDKDATSQTRRRGLGKALIGGSVVGVAGGLIALGAWLNGGSSEETEPGPAPAEPGVAGPQNPGEAPVDTNPTIPELENPDTSPTELPTLSESAQEKLDSLTPENLLAMSPEERTAAATINIRDIDPEGTKTPEQLAELYARLYAEIDERILRADIGVMPRDEIIADDYSQRMIEQYAQPMYSGLWGNGAFGQTMLENNYDFTDAIYKINSSFQKMDIDTPDIIEQPYEGVVSEYVPGTARAENDGDIVSTPLEISFDYTLKSQDRQYLDSIVGDLPAFVGMDRVHEVNVELSTDDEGNIFISGNDSTIRQVEDRAVDTP